MQHKIIIIKTQNNLKQIIKKQRKYIFRTGFYSFIHISVSISLLMDSDFWTSHLAAAAAKRQFTLHHHQISQLDGLNIDDFEADDEVRPDFPCPYCYEDFDIASLCSHLEMTTRASPKSPFVPYAPLKLRGTC